MTRTFEQKQHSRLRASGRRSPLRRAAVLHRAGRGARARLVALRAVAAVHADAGGAPTVHGEDGCRKTAVADAAAGAAVSAQRSHS